MSFNDFKLCSQIVYNLSELGLLNPTNIQIKTIPVVLQGNDVIGLAQTGTGKTAAYALPLLERTFQLRSHRDSSAVSANDKVEGNQVLNLILVPTRELAQQVADNLMAYAFGLGLTIDCVYGGVKINPQMKRLRGGCDFLVATPGRLLDLMERNAVKLNRLQSIVLDEADRMLDLGFSVDLKKIIQATPQHKQSLMFSATLSEPIEELAIEVTNEAVKIQVDVQNSAARTIEHWLHPVDKKLKADLLLELISLNKWRRAIVFVKTKKMAKQLTAQLVKAGISTNCLHGDKSQQERNKAITQFKTSAIDLLVATDVAARGLDVESLPLVVNFDLPKIPEDYIHRIGRTGRAGQKGQAVSLVAADEVEVLSRIESLLGQLIKRVEISGFVPNHSVPFTTLKPVKKKKPHKKKLAKANGKLNTAGSESPTNATNQTQSESPAGRSAPNFLSSRTKAKKQKK